ncbi:MAG: ATP synthase F1 subunit epsilon [Verrucomicrobia bacterium]|nr:ATP synthase F1 subunit epsilon [Verrucomicrobiota bacterium]
MSLTLEIVTPEKRVYSKSVERVKLPCSEGEMEVLPGHIPLITTVDAGEVRTQSKGQSELLAVDKGFVEVFGDKVSILTEAAIDIEDIDLEAAEKAQKRAEEALAKAEADNLDPAEVERLEAVARFAITQKLLKKR